ncbi:hypothetical protein H0H87_000395, partial [Tephrocybe sp. NHM501043]
MHLLHSSLTSTSSGFFLVSTAIITLVIPITLPILEALPNFPEHQWNLVKAPATWKTYQQLEKKNEKLQTNLQFAKSHVQACKMMLEGTQAQLVLQNLHLHKTLQTLFNHKTHKKNDWSLLFNGKVQVLSSDKFWQKIQEQAEQKEAEVAQKVKNAKLRGMRKDALAAMEQERLKIKQDHD